MAERCILNPEQDCIGRIRAEQVNEDLKELKDEFADFRKRNDSAHKEFYNRLAVLEKHNEIQDVKYDNIIDKLADITEKLSNVSAKIAAIEMKPAKKWEMVVEKILLLIVGAIAAIVFAKIGLQ